MALLCKMMRRKVRAREFPAQWLAILERNVSLYKALSPADQKELREHILVFLAEKNFEGCAGLKITDEIKVTIAAQACVLLLHRLTDYYPGLYSILVYPHAYVVERYERDEIGLISEGLETRLGESWAHGSVVLSWDDVRAGAADFHDGHNVVFHEFAHQLDYESGGGDAEGDVLLPGPSRYIAWARILGKEFEKLQQDAEDGRPTVLDKYGAEDPAEFFAVATETFFTRPAVLRQKHPELYEELKMYYQQDPIEWEV